VNRKKRNRLRKRAFDNLLPPAYGVREIERTHRYVMALTDRDLIEATGGDQWMTNAKKK
jgi:hypothetical protein